MRVTGKMFYDQFLSDLHKNLESVLRMQERIASGKRVNRPSDDPVAASRILGYEKQLSSIGEYRKAIDTANNYLSGIDSAFSGLGNVLIRARELATEASNGTLGSVERLMIKSEVDEIAQSVIDIGNSMVGDRYIFSGFQSDLPPIDRVTGESVTDGGVWSIDIGEFADVRLNIPAGEIFTMKRHSPADPVSGVLPPYNWDNGGTIAIPDADPFSALVTPSGGFSGPGDVLTAGGGTLTISVGIDDTTPVTVPVSGGSTLADVRDAINNAAAGVRAEVVNIGDTAAPDFRIVIASDPPGDSERVNLSVVSADLPGQGLNMLGYELLGPKSMTLQGNIANYNYIDDPANPDYYSYNNNFLNDNNILRALSFLQSALENNDSVRIRKAIEYIDGVENKLLRFRAEVGARLNKVESMEKIYLDRETEVKTYLSHDRDADIAELVSSLEQKQAALAGFRSLSSELFSLSLFDFIR